MSQSTTRPVVLTERRVYDASLEEVWGLVANTDAFNRSAGFGMDFEHRDGRLRGRMSSAGQAVEWDELPFDYCHASWFRQTRTLEGGLIARADASADLSEDGPQVALDYRIELYPRHWLLFPVIWLASRWAVRAQIRRGLAGIARALEGGVEALDPPPPLGAAARSALDEGLRELPASLRTSLANRLTHAPLVVQDRLRPKLIARQDGHDPTETAAAMLQAVAAGVLELRWLLLCPRCRGDAQDRAVLELANRGLHCESCGIRYDGALVDNVEAVFRPSARLRTDRPRVDCVVSPSRTPHVLLQCPVDSDHVLTFNVQLLEGTYQLEGPASSCSIQVAPGFAAPSALTLHVFEDGTYPEVLDIAPGKYSLVIENERATASRISLTRRWRPSYGLSASELLCEPRLRALLPDAALAPGHATRSMRVGVLVIETDDPDAYEAVMEALEPVASGVFELGMTLVAATFDTLPAVLAAAEALAGNRLRARAAVSAGVVVVLEQNGQEELAGRPVEAAVQAVRSLQVPQIGFASDAPELLAAIEANPTVMQLVELDGRPPLLAFSASIDGSSLSLSTRGREEAVRGKPVVVPEEVAGYRVVRELDAGATGRVFEVEDPMDGRFAMKVPRFGHTNEIERAAFLQEGLIAKRLRHPNVVAFRDWGVDGDVPYLVMEYLRGRTLDAELAERGPLGPTRTRRLLVAALKGLQAVHALGMVHRDIKPSNVFVVDEASAPAGVKLLDFGLARQVGRRSVERIAGTPDFMAPEQVLLTGVDPRTDLFSLGLVGYWARTGDLPLPGGTLGQRALGRLDQAGMERALAAADMGDLRPVITKALSLDPAERYADALEMVAALDG